MKSEPKKKIEDGILLLSKRIQVLKHELWEKEDKIEQLQKHVLWLETESQLNKKERSDSKDEQLLKLNEENKALRQQNDDSFKSHQHELKQKEDKIEQLLKHVLWLEAESNKINDRDK